MSRVDPIPDAPAAVIDRGDERALTIADYHAGIEIGLRYDAGIELESRASERRERLVSLLEETAADRVIVLGDLADRISAPDGSERDELETVIDAVTEKVPLTLVSGNHDGGVADAFADQLDVVPTRGGRYGDIGLVHGHTWPSREVLDAEIVCMGHEHPQVRLQDEVGGSRVERAWLRGQLDFEPFVDRGVFDDNSQKKPHSPELVVFPAFNPLSGGTWINVPEQTFLSPFLPDALDNGAVYLLDGTHLGAYDSV